MKKIYLLIFILFINFSFLTLAQTQEKICFIYFTGVGCPHCARTDPVLLIDLLRENENVIIIEYEIYQQRENAQLLLKYNEVYDSGLGIPLAIFNKEKYLIGSYSILENMNMITGLKENSCPLIDGSSISFKELDLNELPGKPKIWRNERILIKTRGGEDVEVLRKLLLTDNISLAVKGVDYEVIEPEAVALSGRNVYFDNAIQLDGWIFQWDGEGIEEKIVSEKMEIVNETEELKAELTLVKIISLAAVDAINPCAIAVLGLMLIAILTYNPKKRISVLLAGLAFTSSVFVTYFFYGLIIIRVFQLVQALTAIRLFLYKILGGIAIFLGVLNIKDFFKYRPGGFLTEMPLNLRPKVKKIISCVTSPKGAFIVGVIVTIFLLPCTIGPYIIAGGILSSLEILKTIPWLLIYNLIFILPMLGVTAFVYLGFTTVERVSGWKKRNIKYLHLTTGLILLGLGIAMFFGLV